MFTKNRKLKPCPFCGKEPKTAINYFKVGGGELQLDFSVICPECKIARRVRDDVEGKEFETYEYYMNEAINLWNDRAEEEY
jgi:endogenous inhibitor of DNA gyrase (YacG/DUF329 family)